MRAYFKDLLTFYLLRKPPLTPAAFWRHSAGLRLALGGLLLATTAWLLLGVFTILLSDSRFAVRSSPPAWSILPAALALFIFGKLRKWLYRDRKKRFFEQVWHADFDVCLECGFNLTGLPDRHRCPECGRPFSREVAASAWKQWMDNQDDENPLRRVRRRRWIDFGDP